MADKKTEPKITLEREYIIPLRNEWLKVPKHKRANKAIKALKQFLVKHMKVYSRDLRKIKLDTVLNNEIRFRGMRKPPAKIKVKAVKFDDDSVRVELVNIPEHIKYERLREEKIAKKPAKKTEEKPEEEKITDQEVKKEEQEKEEKSKEKASKEKSLKLAKEQAKMGKHVSEDKHVLVRRKAMSR